MEKKYRKKYAGNNKFIIKKMKDINNKYRNKWESNKAFTREKRLHKPMYKEKIGEANWFGVHKSHQAKIRENGLVRDEWIVREKPPVEGNYRVAKKF